MLSYVVRANRVAERIATSGRGSSLHASHVVPRADRSPAPGHCLTVSQ